MILDGISFRAYHRSLTYLSRLYLSLLSTLLLIFVYWCLNMLYNTSYLRAAHIALIFMRSGYPYINGPYFTTVQHASNDHRQLLS